MSDSLDSLRAQLADYLTVDKALALTRAVVLLAIGLLVASLLARAAARLVGQRLPLQQAQLVRRLVYYLVLALFVVAGMHQLGFNLGVLLGAAGVLSVAVGFASQTSASNLVSGLFLIFERPFEIGDVIQVGGTTGEVLAIDLLSVKLRTFDNIFVRLPNESLIKSEVRTLSRFPVRRIDVQVGVAYASDLAAVRATLMRVADENPLSLDDPKPQLQLLGFGDSAINLQFSVWSLRENFVVLKTRIQEEIKLAFDAAGIEIPFPQRTLSAGGQTAPLPVRIVDPEAPERGTS